MSTSSLPAESGDNTSTNDEAAHAAEDINYLQALKDVELARTFRLRAGALSRLSDDGQDAPFLLHVLQGVYRALDEFQERTATRAGAKRAEDFEADNDAFIAAIGRRVRTALEGTNDASYAAIGRAMVSTRIEWPESFNTRDLDDIARVLDIDVFDLVRDPR